MKITLKVGWLLALFLLTIAPSFAATAFVQGAGARVTSASSTVAPQFTTNSTSGNTIIVVIREYNPTPLTPVAVSNVTDSVGAPAFSAIFAMHAITGPAADGMSTAVYCSHGITGGGTDTVTVTFASTVTFTYISIGEYSGISGCAVDATASFDFDFIFGATTAPASGNLTTLTANDSLIAVWNTYGDTGAMTAGTGYTFDQSQLSGTANINNTEHADSTTTGTYAAAMTATNSTYGTMILLALKSSGTVTQNMPPVIY